jgi:hypothetical protein
LLKKINREFEAKEDEIKEKVRIEFEENFNINESIKKNISTKFNLLLNYYDNEFKIIKMNKNNEIEKLDNKTMEIL